MFRHSNLLGVLQEATPEEWQDGVAWYFEAHIIAAELSPNDVSKAAGVLAALSPQKSWVENVRLAKLAFSQGYAEGTFGAQVAKANRILAGEAWRSVLRGNKERSFAGNIENPNSAGVTIDRHAIDVISGAVLGEAGRKVLENPSVYATAEEVYNDIAKTLLLTGAQVQAIAWVVWRRKKGLR